MGRKYAGIMGPLALITVVLRGLIEGGGVESTLKMACLSLLAFAAIGWVVGTLAGHIVDESVRARFDAEIEAQRDQDHDPAAAKTA